MAQLKYAGRIYSWVGDPGDVPAEWNPALLLFRFKKETSLIIEPHEQGSSLTVIDDYSSRADRKDSSNLPEQVDRSLQAWGAALKSFLFHYNYLRKIPGIECVIDRFWIRLSPMARRITYLLVVITVFELVLLLVFTGVLLLKWVLSSHLQGVGWQAVGC